MTLRLFVRQSFTGAGETEQAQVQSVLDLLQSLGATYPHVVITGKEAQNASTFRSNFELRSGHAFSPRAFRDDRLSLLKTADAMIIVRTGMSESSAFEIAFNIYSGLRIPMFFATAAHAPIKTTLLQDLDDLVPIQYCLFEEALGLKHPLSVFLATISRRRS